MINDIPIVPGEIVLRNYSCLDIKAIPRVNEVKVGRSLGEPNKISLRKKAIAHLIVTNRRILYVSKKDGEAEEGTPEEAKGAKRGITHFHQININDAGDVSIFDGVWRSYTALIISILITIAFFLFLQSPVALIPLAIGLLITFLRPKSLIYISIASKGCMGGFHVGKIGSRVKDSISFSMKPGKDFNLMSRELGSIILDLQQNGDSCICRWVRNHDMLDAEQD